MLIQSICAHSKLCDKMNFSQQFQYQGGCATIYLTCTICKSILQWNSSPQDLRNSNLLAQRLIIATILNGDGYTSYQLLCAVMNLAPVSSSTFHNLQSKLNAVVLKL